MKFNMGTFLFTIIGLFIGGVIAGILLEYVSLGFTSNPIVSAFIVGMIQIATCSMLGVLSGKLNLTSLVLGAVFIFIGSMIGAYLANMLSITGILATFVVLAIQAILLMFTGVASSKGKAFVT